MKKHECQAIAIFNDCRGPIQTPLRDVAKNLPMDNGLCLWVIPSEEEINKLGKFSYLIPLLYCPRCGEKLEVDDA